MCLWSQRTIWDSKVLLGFCTSPCHWDSCCSAGTALSLRVYPAKSCWASQLAILHTTCTDSCRNCVCLCGPERTFFFNFLDSLWYNRPNMKFTTWTMCAIQWHLVHSHPFADFFHHPKYKINTHQAITITLSSPLPSAPGNPYSTFVPYEFDFSRCLTSHKWNYKIFVLLCLAYTQW